MTRVEELKKEIAELHKDLRQNAVDHAKMVVAGNLRETENLKRGRIAILESIVWRQGQLVRFVEIEVEYPRVKEAA